VSALVEQVADRIAALTTPGSRCLVAVSGGPDSLALLDLLHLGAARHGRLLAVGHVDHGIASDSGDVAQTVRWVAEGRGLTFVSRRLTLGAGTSETTARTARQRALREMAGEVGADVIVLGHHADDQVETVLLRLLRGSGPAGLAGMAQRTGVWVRPLLGIRRDDLAGYLAERGIPAWQDPANRSPEHLRSWLRSELLPPLVARLPDVVARIGGAARQAREARVAWEQLLEADSELAFQPCDGGFSVAAPPLRGYRSELRRAIVAALGRRAGVPLGTRRLDTVDRLLSGRDATVQIAPNLLAELAWDRLTLRPPMGPPPPPESLSGEWGSTFGAMRITAAIGSAGAATREGWTTAFTMGQYQVRAWQAGDRIRPLGGRGERAVSVLFREARIAPARRAHWPVVVAADATIVWVPGICRSEACIPTEGTEALCVHVALA
jgi:tRNA(Ile)-lysidine synthase